MCSTIPIKKKCDNFASDNQYLHITKQKIYLSFGSLKSEFSRKSFWFPLGIQLEAAVAVLVVYKL